MISVIYSTRTTKPEFIEQIKKTSGVHKIEIIEIVNDGEMSLTQAYNKGLKETNNDIVVFCHDDIIFNTFVPIFKQVGTNQYLLSSRPSGLNPDLYVFNVSVFKISAVDKITRSTTSVISLNGNRDIEFFIEPDLKQEYFGGLNPSVQPLKIQITNQNPSIFNMTNEVIFPIINTVTDISNAIFTITSVNNPDNLNNVLFVHFYVMFQSC